MQKATGLPTSRKRGGAIYEPPPTRSKAFSRPDSGILAVQRANLDGTGIPPTFASVRRTDAKSQEVPMPRGFARCTLGKAQSGRGNSSGPPRRRGWLTGGQDE